MPIYFSYLTLLKIFRSLFDFIIWSLFAVDWQSFLWVPWLLGESVRRPGYHQYTLIRRVIQKSQKYLQKRSLWNKSLQKKSLQKNTFERNPLERKFLCKKSLQKKSILKKPLWKTFLCTEVRFASFLSGGFTTMTAINPPEKKLSKRTSVQCESLNK